MTKKSITAFGMIVILICTFGFGCGTVTKEKERVALTVWGSPDTQDMLKNMVSEFKKEHQSEVDLEITVGVEDEDTLSSDVVSNPEGAADVYSFAGDQLNNLVGAKALLPLDYQKEDIIKASGGKESTAIKIASKGDTLYGYPLTASNGYFLYYNAAYLNEEDVQSFDRILEVAEKNEKKVTMDWSSGWYLYSFFSGAGLSVGLNDDGSHNVCNWNTKDTQYKGTDVAKALLDISASDGFLNADEDRFKQGVENGSVIAVVNGMWNANYFEKAWRENYRAAKLPTYTLAGNQVQMNSVAGYKLMGVNAHTKYPDWAMKLAAWISNYDNQLKRFEVTGESPANVEAAESDKVKQSPAVAALAEQSPYAKNLEITDSYWTATTIFGTVMANGNPDKKDLQQIMDELVDNIEK